MKKIILSIILVFICVLEWFIWRSGDPTSLWHTSHILIAIVPFMLLSIASYSMKDIINLIVDVYNKEIKADGNYKKDLEILDGSVRLLNGWALIYFLICLIGWFSQWEVLFSDRIFIALRDSIIVPFYLVFVRIVIILPCQNIIKTKLKKIN